MTTNGSHEVLKKEKEKKKYPAGELGWFPHERLDVFRVSLEFAAWVRAARTSIPRAKLRSQLEEAAESIVLNVCEAAGRSGGSRRNQFEIAYGSAAECHGAVSLCRIWGVPKTEEALILLDRIRRMLARLH